MKSRKRPTIGKKRFFRDYFQQLKRPKLEDYFSVPSTTKNRIRPYIFSIASLWADKEAQNTVNLIRKNFMEAARKTDCDFEGGFYAAPDHIQYEIFEELVFLKPYTPQEYLEKTKASYLVFNTPAVHGCHGWKLGEYLAMGKAILSTPLQNDLAYTLISGQEMHCMHSENGFKNSLNKLLKDEGYKNALEKNAKLYFDSQCCTKSSNTTNSQYIFTHKFSCKNR